MRDHQPYHAHFDNFYPCCSLLEPSSSLPPSWKKISWTSSSWRPSIASLAKPNQTYLWHCRVSLTGWASGHLGTVWWLRSSSTSIDWTFGHLCAVRSWGCSGHRRVRRGSSFTLLMLPANLLTTRRGAGQDINIDNILVQPENITFFLNEQWNAKHFFLDKYFGQHQRIKSTC